MSGERIASVSSAQAAPTLTSGPGRSWPDWILDQIDRVPAPRWLVHLGLILIFTLIGHVVRWLDGSLATGQLSYERVVEASFLFLFLFAIRTLDEVALRALGTLRPALDARDEMVVELQRDLTRTPRVTANLAAVVGILGGIESVSSNPVHQLLPSNSAFTWAVGVYLSVAAFAAAMAFVAHAVHQLRIVGRVHSELARVELFRLEPLYAFSTLTSWTGIALLGFLVYGIGGIVLVSGPAEYVLSPADLAGALVMLLAVVACFVVPLLGLHGRISAEKNRRMTKANASLERALVEVDKRIGAGEFDRAAAATGALTAATMALAAVARVSPWPWHPDTFRGFAGALGFPVAVWLITAALSRLIRG